MAMQDVKTLVAGETLNCTEGAYAGRRVVALIPVGYGAKVCARTCGNAGGAKQDYATTGVYAANGSTAADLPGYTPSVIGFDLVTVPAGSQPVTCWMEY